LKNYIFITPNQLFVIRISLYYLKNVLAQIWDKRSQNIMIMGFVLGGFLLNCLWGSKHLPE